MTVNNSIQYNFDEKSQTIYGMNDPENHALLNIPEKINGIMVKRIGDGAFENNQIITMVNIPNTVESIGDSAFAGCENLLDVRLPISIKEIGDNAFANCVYMCQINFPKGSYIEHIGINAFRNCMSLRLMAFDKIKEINENSFRNSPIRDIYAYNQDVTIIADTEEQSIRNVHIITELDDGQGIIINAEISSMKDPDVRKVHLTISK